MSGKSYTLREMKSIVDYLTANHLYGEVKGRKMWMDFANSNLTTRTWQSLKETFSKRILPEICNTYYRLDPDQILSFKQGMDLTQKDKRLEFRHVNTHKKDTAKENDTAKSPKSPLKDGKVHEIHSDSSTGNKDLDPQVDSVSLFEQLSTTKFSDSGSNNKENANDQRKTHAQNGTETKTNKDHSLDLFWMDYGTKVNEDQNNEQAKAKKQTQNDVILLNSRSTSESVDDSDNHHSPLACLSLKIQKDNKLASGFGFSNGGASKPRRSIGRKRTTSHRKVQSDSSDWSSNSDSEYVSPPRGTSNRFASKYLKPRASQIMSDEEDGALFVILGKKVYPLVKAGQHGMNFVTYLSESDTEEDSYIEERKRTDKLQKTENPSGLPPSQQESVQGNELMQLSVGSMENPENQKTLKIKLTTNDRELIQLEGHWQHINPVLAQVVSMLHKDAEKEADTVTCVELSSGNTTPTPPSSTTAVIPTEAPKDTAQVVSILHKDAEKKADTVTYVELSSGNTTPTPPSSTTAVIPTEAPKDTAQVVSILHKDAEKKADTVTCVELSSGNTTPTSPSSTTAVIPTEAPKDTAQVVSILHKDVEKKADTVTCVELSSGNTTPTPPSSTTAVIPTEAPKDTGVRDTEELESEIFKQIEDEDKKDNDAQEYVVQKDDKEISVSAINPEVKDTDQENIDGQSNITQRKKRGRPKRAVSPAVVVAQSPAKKPKHDVEIIEVIEDVKAQDAELNTLNAKRPTRTHRKLKWHNSKS